MQEVPLYRVETKASFCKEMKRQSLSFVASRKMQVEIVIILRGRQSRH